MVKQRVSELFLRGLIISLIFCIPSISLAKDIDIGLPGDSVKILGNNLCLNSSCITDWLSISGLWSINGTSIYYNTGNVGIGITNPVAALDVYRTEPFRTRGQVVFAGSPYIGSGNRLLMVNNDGNVFATTISAVGLPDSSIPGQTLRSNGTTWVASSNIFNNDTNVGIGTTNPLFAINVVEPGFASEVSAVGIPAGRSISVQGSGGAFFMGRDVTNDIEFIMGVSSMGETFGGTMTNHNFNLRTNNTNRLTVQATSGNIGIGITTPSQKLHVNGGAQLDAVSYGVTPGTSQPSALTTVEFVNAKVTNLLPGGASSTWALSGNNIYNTNSGNVGIGTATTGAKLTLVDHTANVGGIRFRTAATAVDLWSRASAILTTAANLEATSFRAANGTVGAPAFSFLNDTNTGMYSGGTDILRFSTAGADRMTILANGNVGIGTTNPGVALQIGSDATNPTVLLESTSSGDNNTVQSAGIEFGENSSARGSIWYTGDGMMHIGMNNRTREHMRFQYSANNTWLYGNLYLNGASNNTYFPGSGIWASNGAVGIGTTAPGHKLSVTGSATSYSIDAGNQRIGNVADPDTVKDVVTLGFLNSSLSAFAPGGASSTWALNGNNIYNTNSGNVGIGTSNPGSYKLNVFGNTYLNGDLTVSGLISGVKNKTNTVRNNLGTPTVQEMALFHGQFNNKFRFIPPTLQEESADGSTWVASTRASAATLADMMIGEGQSTSFNAIPAPAIGGSGYYRLTWDNASTGVGYVFLNDLYVYNSTNGNNVTFTIEQYHNTNGWSTVTSGTISNWPGHTEIPHTSIPFSTSASQYGKVRVTFSITNATYANPFNLYAIEWFGGYPAGRRNAEYYDRDKNVTFPAAIKGGSGSVGVPSFSFSSDTNSGMYSGGSDVLRLVTGGVDRVTILNNGNVGIGTTAPTETLHVNGTAKFNGLSYGMTPGTSQLSALTTVEFVNAKVTNLLPGGASSTWALSGNNIYNTNSGNVGIGTATTGAKLTLVDHTTNIGGIRFRTAATAVDLWSRASAILTTAANFEAASFRAANGTVSAPAFSFLNDTNTGMYSGGTDILKFSTAGADRMTILANGNVGVGITNPSSNLHIAATNSKIILSSPLGGDQRLTLTGGNGATQTIDSTYNLKFSSGFNYNISLMPGGAGNVGIGTTVPGHKLSVTGSATSYSIDAGNQRIGNVADPTATKDVVTLGFLNSSLSAFAPVGASSTWTISGNNIYNNNQIGNVGIGTIAPSNQLTQKSTTALESATLGSELLSSSNWTTTGWTGDFSSGFTHTTGNTTAITNTLAAVTNNLYQIDFTVTGRTAGTFTITFGGVTSGGYSASSAWGPKATSAGTLSITPTTNFNGTIVISIKQITGVYNATYAIQDNTGANAFEIRNTLASLGNTFIGLGAGRYNTTGSYNSAQGYASLYSNTTGGGNSAQGYASLYSNTTGNNNSAQGMYSLYLNTTGGGNSAQGYASLYSNTTGNSNSAQGMYSLYLNTTTGGGNSAQGDASLRSNTTGSYNSAQGYASLFSNTTGGGNSAQGYGSLYSNTTGNSNSAQGYYSLLSNTTGNYNSAVGYQAGRYLADGTTGRSTGNNGLYLGANTRASADGMNNEIVIGYGAIGGGSDTATYGNTSITKHIFSDGNVGIGTTGPGAALHVNNTEGFYTLGSVTFGGPLYKGRGAASILTVDNSGNVYATSTSAITTAVGLPTSATNGQTLRYNNGSWINNSVLYNNGTNVGIGTATVGAKLTLVDHTNNVGGIRFRTAATAVDLWSRASAILTTAANFEATSFRAANGTVSAPAFSFLNDTNTGMYSGGTDILKFSTASADRMTILANGNVGISNTNPQEKLDLSGGVMRQSGYLVSDAATDNMLVNGDFEMNGTYGWSGLSTVVSGGVSGNYTAQITGSASFTSKDFIPVDPTKDIFHLEAWLKKTVAGTTPGVLYFGYMAYDANKNLITSAPCGTYCYFAASGYNLPADGNWHKVSATTIGEGTSYPNFPVGTRYVKVMGLINHSSSADSVTQLDHVTLKRITKGPLIAGNNFSSSNIVDNNQYSTLYTTAANNLVINSPGNVGIGTTAPGHKLSVAGSATNYSIDAGNQRIGNVADPDTVKDVVTLGFLNSSLSAFAPGGASSTWALNGNNIYNTNSGNVGIGTATTGAKLTLADHTTNVGGIRFRTAATAVDLWSRASAILTTAANLEATSFRAANGTVGAPAFSFLNDTNTGMYSGGTDILKFSTAGADRMTILANGNVGIGTTGPNDNLTIHSSLAWAGIGIKGGTGGSYIDFYKQNGTKLGGFTMDEATGGLTLRSYAGTNASVIFQTNSVERVRVDSTGNVGIGTTTPTKKLHVNGETKFDGLSYGVTPGSTQPLALTTVEYVNAKVTNLLPGGASSTWALNGNNIYNTNSGNVGIGTATTGAKLTLVDHTTNVGGIRFRTAATAVDLWSRASAILTTAANFEATSFRAANGTVGAPAFSFLNDTNTGMYSGGTDILKFSTAGADRMTILANGNVGIGTTAPGAKLSVSGSAIIGGTAYVTTGLELSTGGAQSVSYYGPQTNGYFEAMEQTATAGYGTYGPVTSDWAMYNRFSGANTRGWIWQLGTTNVAAISGLGHLQIAGNLNSQGTGSNYFAGNVGIGTTAPTQKLSIGGSATYAIDAGNQRIGNVADPDTVKDVVTLGFLNSSLSAFAPGGASSTWALNGNNIYNTNSGNVGIGTNNPQTMLTLGNNGWLSAINNNDTGYINMFRVNTNNQIEVGGPLLINQFQFATDSGYNTFVDMPVTAASSLDSIQGYALRVDGENLLTVYSESDGSGGIKNKRVGINVTNPATADLDINGYMRTQGINVKGFVSSPGIVVADDLGNLSSSPGLTLKTTYVNNVDYNVNAADSIIAYSAINGNRTVNIPDSLCTPGRFFVIMDQSGASSPTAQIIINPEGSTPIVGNLTFSLSSPYNSVYVFCGKPSGTPAWFLL